MSQYRGTSVYFLMVSFSIGKLLCSDRFHTNNKHLCSIETAKWVFDTWMNENLSEGVNSDNLWHMHTWRDSSSSHSFCFPQNLSHLITDSCTSGMVASSAPYKVEICGSLAPANLPTYLGPSHITGKTPSLTSWPLTSDLWVCAAAARKGSSSPCGGKLRCDESLPYL